MKMLLDKQVTPTMGTSMLEALRFTVHGHKPSSSDPHKAPYQEHGNICHFYFTDEETDALKV